ncbi:hypothetical protein V3C99_015897 [Haemonchus contortus]
MPVQIRRKPNGEAETFLESTQSESADEKNDETKENTTHPDRYADLDADKLMDAYGFGRYQFFGYFLSECMNFFYSAAMYVMPYVEPNPVLECTFMNESIPVDPECRIMAVNEGSPNGVCGTATGTNLTIRDPPYSSSLITEFGISCSSFIWKEAGLTAFTIGAVLVVPGMSALSDEYGRRPVAVICLFIAFICHSLASVAPDYIIFILLRFIIGASSDTYYSVRTTLTCELLPSRSRAWITVVQTIAWVFGMFWVGLLSLFIHKWRLMYFACAAPGILTVVYYFFLPESPYWLIQHKEYKRIEQYIETANKWNNTVIDIDACRREGPSPDEKRETCAAMARSPQMIKLLLINGFIEFVMAFYYFGLSFLSVDLSDDRFTAYMLSAFVELPGGLVVLPLMMYAGRRTLCLLSMVSQGIFVIVAPFFKIHPIYISEMTPTSVRSLSYSIINIAQSVGIIVAPYLRHIRLHPEYVKFAVVGVLCIIAGVLCMFLPETMDRPLPADIKDLTKNIDRVTDNSDTEESYRKRDSHDYDNNPSREGSITRQEERL